MMYKCEKMKRMILGGGCNMIELDVNILHPHWSSHDPTTLLEIDVNIIYKCRCRCRCNMLHVVVDVDITCCIQR